MAVLPILLALIPQQSSEAKPARLEADTLRAAGRVAGLDFSDDELELMRSGASEHLASFERLRAVALDNSDAPASSFTAFLERLSRGHAPPRPLAPVPRALGQVERPARLEDLCYADIPTLAGLIRSRAVSCSELVEMYLARLERLDERLLCLVTPLRERARAQAQRLDEELAQGKWRGMLHGIPWGAKDLLAVAGAPTTWGTAPFEDQVFETDAEVVRRLDEAGAVLIGKLTLGELAWGDVWFGGVTRNPWNPEQGSSGSSAGPAAATAAGCVVFAIGSETCGSILSPSARCGCSSLRPTYGRVSRRGAMALAWSMDKLGPLCRSAGDAAIVFGAIARPDPGDDHLIDRPFADLGPADVRGMKVGYLPGSWRSEAREKRVLEELARIGVETAPVELPDYPVDELMFLLSAEAAAAFDELTRDGRDDAMKRQEDQAWPNVFRVARLIPAVEYLRAERIRRRYAVEMDRLMESLDALVHPTTDGRLLQTFSLTGHPSVCAPAGPREDGTPRSLSFSGRLFDEARLLALAEAWQRSTGYHEAHPGL